MQADVDVRTATTLSLLEEALEARGASRWQQQVIASVLRAAEGRRLDTQQARGSAASVQAKVSAALNLMAGQCGALEVALSSLRVRNDYSALFGTDESLLKWLVVQGIESMLQGAMRLELQQLRERRAKILCRLVARRCRMVAEVQRIFDIGPRAGAHSFPFAPACPEAANTDTMHWGRGSGHAGGAARGLALAAAGSRLVCRSPSPKTLLLCGAC